MLKIDCEFFRLYEREGERAPSRLIIETPCVLQSQLKKVKTRNECLDRSSTIKRRKTRSYTYVLLFLLPTMLARYVQYFEIYLS